jgi:beta-glucosidase
MEGGNALADLLFGAANFSGRLPMTWPKRWEDEPALDNDNETRMDYYHGYRHFDLKGIEPLYPFGFGLSYTAFSYANATIACPDGVGPTSIVDVQVDVTNTGASAGSDVAMLFVGYPNTNAPRRSLKELKGFTRVALEPGEMKTVHIPLRVRDLAYYDMAKSAWVTETAAYDVWVGPNARDLTLKTSLVVQ